MASRTDVEGQMRQHAGGARAAAAQHQPGDGAREPGGEVEVDEAQAAERALQLGPVIDERRDEPQQLPRRRHAKDTEDEALRPAPARRKVAVVRGDIVVEGGARERVEAGEQRPRAEDRGRETLRGRLGGGRETGGGSYG